MTSIAIRNQGIATPLGNVYSEAVEEFFKKVYCPRSECEVYSIGISLEYFVGSVFIALGDIEKGDIKADYTQLAMRQLEKKEKIVTVNNRKLNQMLQYFYDNGGPIIEPPVDEQKAAKIAPRFNTLINDLFDRMDVVVNEASAGAIKAERAESEINAAILEMYSAMKALYREYELRNAFDELIRIRTEKN